MVPGCPEAGQSIAHGLFVCLKWSVFHVGKGIRNEHSEWDGQCIKSVLSQLKVTALFFFPLTYFLERDLMFW